MHCHGPLPFPRQQQQHNDGNSLARGTAKKVVLFSPLLAIAWMAIMAMTTLGGGGGGIGIVMVAAAAVPADDATLAATSSSSDNDKADEGSTTETCQATTATTTTTDAAGAATTCAEDADVAASSTTTATSTTTSTSTSTTTIITKHYFPGHACRLVMAPSTIDEAGWGVFVMRGNNNNKVGGDDHWKQGQALGAGDVVLHLHDLLEPHESPMTMRPDGTVLDAAAWMSLRRIIVDYSWDPDETGGFYEGLLGRTVALGPGLPMLANGLPRKAANALPFVPTVDEGGETRLHSPGAGAFTHYHNWTVFVKASTGIPAGAELFLPYGDAWFTERQGMADLQLTAPVDKAIRTNEELQLDGYCIDNVKPLPRSTQVRFAGRGLQAARHLPANSIILPVPVLPLWQGRQLLQLWRKRATAANGDGNTGEREEVVELQQLMRNYCYGHPQSSLLLFPYGPMINLINHASSSATASTESNPPPQPNVRLQWTTRNQAHEHSLATLFADIVAPQSQSNRTSSTLLLELVTLRDIVAGEELLLDYGPAWQEAWDQHVAHWQPPPDAQTYAPAYVHDDAIRALRTVEELQTHPYPENIFTSCFYIYHNETEVSRDAPSSSVTTVQWKQERGIFQLAHLRPCLVLRRENSPLANQRKKQGTLFTVQIKNRPGPAHAHHQPRVEGVHVVTHVPRHAIRFSDKLYSTDVHLPTAFRREIDLPDNVFPDAWKDLA